MKERIIEIKNRLTALESGKCSKQELIPQLLALQEQLVSATFNSKDPSLRIGDVENRLIQMNDERGGIASNQLDSFLKQSKILKEMIRAELSGAKGENKAYKSLQTSLKSHYILRNIELSVGAHRSEIDLVVITEKKIFLIEVKNTSRDIVIDKKGNYCRMTKYGSLAFDKNIGEQMNEKEYLLREVIKSSGIKNVKFQSLVVFTDSGVRVNNNYKYIKACYLSQLPHIIEESMIYNTFSDEEMKTLADTITNAQCSEEYYVDMDVVALKNDFAMLLATLEQSCPNKSNIATVKNPKRENIFSRLFRRITAGACAIFG